MIRKSCMTFPTRSCVETKRYEQEAIQSERILLWSRQVSKRCFHAGIERAGRPRRHRARVGERGPAIAEIGNGGGVEESPVIIIASVEKVLDARVDFDVLADNVG